MKGGEKGFGGEEENGRGGKKRVKSDSFAELPDPLLIHILSFLKTKEAAITSVLSKRWESLWADLPKLEFHGGKIEVDKVSKFVSWINRSLSIRTKGIYLEKLIVSFVNRKSKGFCSDVDAWVQFVKENNVRDLGLYLVWADHSYRPHQALYSCSSLTRLELLKCDMDTRTRIEWHSLTYLYLFRVRIEQHLLDQILSASCPVLHQVKLLNYHGFDRLEAKSRRLHCLTLTEDDDGDVSPLEISAPYLHTLNACVGPRKWTFVNISSLVRVCIVEFLWGSISGMIGARDLLESVQNVKELHLGSDFIKFVSSMAVNGWQLPRSRRELLMIVSENVNIFSGVIGLLESSPKLESFYILIEGWTTQGEDVILEQAAKDDLAGDLLHLKETYIVTTLADSKDEEMILTLVRILLKRAPVLEKIYIKCEAKDKSNTMKMAQIMHAYPVISTKVVGIIYSVKASTKVIFQLIIN